MSTAAGQLLHHEEITTSLKGARAYLVRYASRDVGGRPTQSTGVVIAPLAAGTDRPVLTWMHGTTGIGDAARPSARPDPARELITYFDVDATEDVDYGVPGAQSFIDDGWIVCATDYQGLGTPGVHQYTVNITNALDGLHIAHAARALDIGMGTELASAGWSEGGGSAPALAELDAAEYGDFVLIGVVAFAPGVTAAALKAGSGASVDNPSAPPDPHAFMLVQGFAAAFPESLKLEDIFTPLGVQVAEATRDTLPVHHLADVLARTFHHGGPLVRTDPQNLPAWEKALITASAGQRKPACPVLVCEDIGNPPGKFPCPIPWQDIYVEMATAQGGDVTVRKYPDDDHFSVCQTAMPAAKEWLEGLRRTA